MGRPPDYTKNASEPCTTSQFLCCCCGAEIPRGEGQVRHYPREGIVHFCAKYAPGKVGK